MFGTGLTQLIPEPFRKPVAQRIHRALELGFRLLPKKPNSNVSRPHPSDVTISGSQPLAKLRADDLIGSIDEVGSGSHASDSTVDGAAPFTKYNLDDFIKQIDEVGDPSLAAADFALKHFSYKRTVVVDDRLDPYSDQYWNQQIDLYREITGRELDQGSNELVQFDLDAHVGTLNSYASTDPKRMVIHYARLSKLIKHAALPDNARVLDLGCGWGLSSEFLAMLGCRVTAVDINEKFVELVKRRSHRMNYGIKAIHSGFDDLHLNETFDLILFYECLHHAVKPWELLQKVSSWLSPRGKIALAGEPIQNIWWRSWGLRLDGLSVYCMRKFGWFENGWSKDFIIDALSRCGLIVDYKDDVDPDVGPIIIATRR